MRTTTGPGTGKSATMVALVDHLLTGNPAPRLKLLTVTRAATAVSDIRRQLPSARALAWTGMQPATLASLFTIGR
jgi:hypothetical protein